MCDREISAGMGLRGVEATVFKGSLYFHTFSTQYLYHCFANSGLSNFLLLEASMRQLKTTLKQELK